MQTNTCEFYASTNGDKWFLRHEVESGHVYVKHVANRSAGGQQTDSEVDAFLHRSTGSPEREALLRLIGTLAEKHQDI